MSSLKITLKDDQKAAMRAKEKDRLAVIRQINAAIKQVEVDQQTELTDDADVIKVLTKMVKQRRDSITSTKQLAARTGGTGKAGAGIYFWLFTPAFEP